MNSIRPPVESWLNFVRSTDTVLGPSRGNVPDIGAFRIASLNLLPHALMLYGSVTGLPAEAESNGERDKLRRVNFLLEIEAKRVVTIFGRPQLDSENNDTMHGFQLALPVAVEISKTQQAVYPGSDVTVLKIIGKSSHLNFEMEANSVEAFGGKHAKKRFEASSNVVG